MYISQPQTHKTGGTQGGIADVTPQLSYSYLMIEQGLGRTFIFHGGGCELINK